MKEFQEVLSAEASITVTQHDTAKNVKSGSLDVLGTPVLIALLEQATCLCVEPLLDEGETTVGTKITVTHDKASAVGETVTAKAELKQADGRRLTFCVSATDSKGDIVGKGEIERFVVISDKFMKRVQCQ